MQTSNFKVMLKRSRLIMMPLIMGTSIGTLAGIGIVLLGRLLAFNYSHKQEAWAFIGFVLLGCFFGLVDSVSCFLAWLRLRKGNGANMIDGNERLDCYK